MKLTATVKLLPTQVQAQALLSTLERANAAANLLSQIAWETQTFGKYQLQKLAYHTIRESTSLSAQVVVRLIAKVADAYKVDRKCERHFRPHGGISYDDRVLKWHGDSVSVWSVAGRLHIPFVCDKRTREMLGARRGESILICRSSKWYLCAAVDCSVPPVDRADEWLGVDLGIVNVAADSDGIVYTGGAIRGIRRRHARLRQRLQAKGTKAAKRLLHHRKRKERRFAAAVNHRISKQLVTQTKHTKRGIALEDLTGIRARIRVPKAQRRSHHTWAFYQLRLFIEYKAQRAGVPVVWVDPHNTSRTCPACGHIDKANRPTQSKFLCVKCGFAGLADTIAAENIRRAAVNRPYSVAGFLSPDNEGGRKPAN